METDGAFPQRSIHMAKIEIEEDEPALDIVTTVADDAVAVTVDGDYELQQEAIDLLKSHDFKVSPLQVSVEHARCSLTLNAEDLKFLQENPTSYFTVHKGPFAILVQFEETPLDYLERTFTPPTPKA